MAVPLEAFVMCVLHKPTAVLYRIFFHRGNLRGKDLLISDN
ncbi:DUF1196 domain-containing protein [Vibrio cholerae]|nr:DUF1196 domain-containing protein [Vibrio cholerae]